MLGKEHTRILGWALGIQTLPSRTSVWARKYKEDNARPGEVMILSPGESTAVHINMFITGKTQVCV